MSSDVVGVTQVTRPSVRPTRTRISGDTWITSLTSLTPPDQRKGVPRQVPGVVTKHPCVVCGSPTSAQAPTHAIPAEQWPDSLQQRPDWWHVHGHCLPADDARVVAGRLLDGLDLAALVGPGCDRCGYRIGHHPDRCGEAS